MLRGTFSNDISIIRQEKYSVIMYAFYLDEFEKERFLRLCVQRGEIRKGTYWRLLTR